MTEQQIAYEVWNRTRPSIETLVTRLKEHRPLLTATLGHHSTETFPLTGYGSFSLCGHPADEDLVASVACKLTEGTWACTADISEGNGNILLDGPSLIAISGSANLEQMVLGWAQDVAEFFEDIPVAVLLRR